MVNRNMLPVNFWSPRRKNNFPKVSFSQGRLRGGSTWQGVMRGGRCEKGTKGREGLFQFFGEINRIISSLSWFVSCLMIRYLFKVVKDTWLFFFSGLRTQVVPSFVTCCTSCVLTFASALYRCVPARWEPEARGSVWIDSNPCPQEQPASYTNLLLTNICTIVSLCIFQNIFIPQHNPKVLAINHLP